MYSPRTVCYRSTQQTTASWQFSDMVSHGQAGRSIRTAHFPGHRSRNNGVLHLTQEMLARFKVTLGRWSSRSKHDLQSLIGTLQHACRVVRSGSTCILRCPHHHVRLNNSFRADLHWWLAFVSEWNGVAMVTPTSPLESIVTSDALKQWGCRAWHNHKWFQY